MQDMSDDIILWENPNYVAPEEGWLRHIDGAALNFIKHYLRDHKAPSCNHNFSREEIHKIYANPETVWLVSEEIPTPRKVRTQSAMLRDQEKSSQQLHMENTNETEA